MIPCVCPFPLQDLHSGQRQPADMERERGRRRPLHLRGQEPVWHGEQQRERHRQRYFLLPASPEGLGLSACCRRLMSRAQFRNTEKNGSEMYKKYINETMIILQKAKSCDSKENTHRQYIDQVLEHSICTSLLPTVAQPRVIRSVKSLF